MKPFASVEDVINLWRKLTQDEIKRADALLPVISDILREEAKKVDKNIDELAETPSYKSVLTSVTVDILARILMTSTNQEPTTQYSQSAMGYSVSGSFLVPGGGVFVKKSELARLGLKKQRYGGIELYDTRNNDIPL